MNHGGEFEDDDPDAVDGNQPRNQYEPVDVPMGANVADQRAAEDAAEGRDQRRRAQREQLQPNQVRQGGQIYNRPGELPRGNVPVDANDNNYIQLQVIDAARPPNPNELGNGGSERVDAGAQPHSQYDRVTEGEWMAHVQSLSDAVDSLKTDAVAKEAAQDAAGARAARMRKFAIANLLLGGVAMLSTIGVILYAILSRPKEIEGPVAMDIDGGDNLDPTKKASVDAAGRALPGQNGSPIDKASVELASHDDNSVTTKTLAGVGLWEAANDGTISFTPDQTFQGGAVSIVYSIADTGKARSARAQITFGFRSKTLPGTGGPLVQSFEETHTVADTIVIDVAGTAKPGSGGGAVKPDSIILHDAATQTPKEVFQRGIGTWTADDKGKITFVPIDGFLGGGAREVYTIADATGNRSDSAEISLSFYKRPKVFDIVAQVTAFSASQPASVNVIDGSAGVPQPIPDPAFTIDPASVVLTGVTMSEGEAKGPDTTAKNGMKQLVVAGEGTWDASDAGGKVTFTPDAALTGDPHPVSYQVADSKGVLSNVGTLTMSTVADKVVAALGKINQLTDDNFWTMYETNVVKADLGDDPIGKLLLMRAVTSDLWLNTRDGLDAATRDTVFSTRDDLVRNVLGADFDTWRAGNATDAEPPLSPEKLFTMSKDYNDAKVALPGIALATRYIRLYYIDMMLGFFARYIDNQMNTNAAGGGNAGQNNGRN